MSNQVMSKDSKSAMKRTEVVTTDDVLLTLCHAVTGVLNAATNTTINYSAMVQKINKTLF